MAPRMWSALTLLALYTLVVPVMLLIVGCGTRCTRLAVGASSASPRFTAIIHLEKLLTRATALAAKLIKMCFFPRAAPIPFNGKVAIVTGGKMTKVCCGRTRDLPVHLCCFRSQPYRPGHRPSHSPVSSPRPRRPPPGVRHLPPLEAARLPCRTCRDVEVLDGGVAVFQRH